MKNIIIKYKEIIISIIIILVFSGISGFNYFNKYKSFSDNSNKPSSKEDSNKLINIESNSYDCEKSWNITTNKADGDIEYIEFIDKDIGYMYKIKDVAMTMAWGSISKTTDGGKTWKEVSFGINERFKRNSQVKFFDYYLGFITMPYNGDNSCELYVTTNGGETFNKVEVEHTELDDKQFKWEEIYDSYNMPTKENGIYYLEVGQGTDGDYAGGNSIIYYSYNGISWTTEELEKQYQQNWKKQISERVENRDRDIFLKDFENYDPSSSEIKLSQVEAEKIAEIGFKEINETIGEAGDKERQTVTIEKAIANNLFTDIPASYHKIYKNIKRMCYVFIRENDMGCGSKVYVDATTGLIIGGECFGD